MKEDERQRTIQQQLAGMGISHPRYRESLSTGFPAVDAALGTGGLPRGGIVEIFGVASCGKTGFALQVIGHAQRTGARAAWIDAEHVLDAGFAAQLGVDLENLPVAQPSTAEEALDMVRRFAASAAVDLIVLDSAAALVPELEIEAGLGRAATGLQTRLLASELRRLSRIAARSGSCIVFLNQTRARFGTAGEADTSSGGAPIKLYAAVRLVLAAAGRRVRFRVLKNRFASPFRETILEWHPGAGFVDTRGKQF